MICLAVITTQIVAAKLQRLGLWYSWTAGCNFFDKTRKTVKCIWQTNLKNPPSWLTKTENHRLNWRKPANRTRHQNRKTAIFDCKNRTKNWPNPQNRKSQRLPLEVLRYVANYFTVLRYLRICGIAMSRTPNCPTQRGDRINKGVGRMEGFRCGSKGKNKD